MSWLSAGTAWSTREAHSFINPRFNCAFLPPAFCTIAFMFISLSTPKKTCVLGLFLLSAVLFLTIQQAFFRIRLQKPWKGLVFLFFACKSNSFKDYYLFCISRNYKYSIRLVYYCGFLPRRRKIHPFQLQCGLKSSIENSEPFKKKFLNVHSPCRGGIADEWNFKKKHFRKKRKKG